MSFVVFLQFFSSKGRFLEKFSGANFCFWVLVLGLCFLVGFCLCFCFIFGGSLPKVFGKNSLDVRSAVFWVLSLLLWFFRRRRFWFFFFLRDRDQVVTGHPPHTHLFFWFFFFLCPAAFVCSARFGRASRFLAFCRGAILGPGRFWDSPWTF